MRPVVAIIVLNWNGKDDTAECLESLRKVTYPNFKVLLVDNASTDGSVELFKRDHPDIELLVNEKNLGFAGGNNVGIRRALEEGADYLLLLNNDTVVCPDFLGGLVDIAEGDPRVGIVGPKICFYSDPEKVWSAGGRINMFTGRIGNDGEGLPQKDLRGTKEVDYVSGCALLIKSGVARQIGLMDEDYFLYFEETDWNMRARRQGYVCAVNNGSRILHKSGAAVKKIKGSDYYYTVRNLPRFVSRNGKWYHKAIFYPQFFARYAAAYALHGARGEREVCLGINRGISDFLKGHYGRYEPVS
jgi:GT2 family glycosyltransferase